jgi:hypothetical protein
MVWYNAAKAVLMDPTTVAADGPMDLANDILHVSLHTSSYVMNTTGDVVWSDTDNEITATSYAHQPLLSVAVTADNANDRAELDAADTVFTAIGNGTNATFTDIIIFRIPSSSTGGGDGWNVIAHDDTFSATTTNGGNITLTWNAQGILQIT